MSKNDEKVLKLKEQIKIKMEQLGENTRFSPMTNCVLELDKERYNINVLQKDTLQLLLVKLNALQMSARDLKIVLELSGYSLPEWIVDIKSRLSIIQYKEKENELKQLEYKLDKMLSEEKKTELELDEIENTLK